MVAAALLVGAKPADAGWWHRWHGGSSGGSSGSYGSHGSSGGWAGHGSSWGSYGSSGGSSGGSYGSSGGGYGGSYGSSGGGYGSSGGGYSSGWGGSSGGGSSGGYSSYYSGYGSSGGGSSGGSYYSTPVAPAPMIQGQVPDSSAKPALPLQGEGGAIPANPMDRGAQRNSRNATLTVSVPADAKIYVNGLPTRSIGEVRRYVSRGLSDGMSYTYEVRAVADRNGETVEETKKVEVRAGQEVELAFSFANGNELANTSPVETTLSVQVPEDAHVSLAGNTTNGTGEVRVFKTHSLTTGEAWDNYKIVVSVERDGRTLSQEKTITLKAGDSQNLAFDFDGAKVANAR